MNYHILIDRLIVDAWVGIHPHEQRMQAIILSLKLLVSANLGESYDAIEHTVNYEEVITQIKDFLKKKRFKLIETLADGIADLILNYPNVRKIEVTAGKPQILNSRHISVSISKDQNARKKLPEIF